MLKLARQVVYGHSRYLQTLYEHSKSTETPFFTVPSSHISIIQDPLDFYIKIIKNIKRSSFRIGLSSLYLGTGPLQRYVLNQIFKKYEKTNKINVRMVYDYHRSKREEKGESSMDMLQQFHNRVDNRGLEISFLKTGNRGGILGEISSVHHQKIYIFDNNLIIGGANLSNTYFLNRKDRYILIKNHPELCDYFYDYLNILSDSCVKPFKIDEIEGLMGKRKDPGVNWQRLKQHYKLWKYNFMPEEYQPTIDAQQKKIEQIKRQKQTQINRTINFDKPRPKQIMTINEQISRDIGTSIQTHLSSQLPLNERKKKKEQVRKNLFTIHGEDYVHNELIEIQDDEEEGSLQEIGEKVYLFPFVHFKALKETSEPSLLEKIMKIAQIQNHRVRIASGYLNFNKQLMDILFGAKEKSEVEVLCSAPEANSFFQGGAFKKYIPYFYRCFEHSILTQNPKPKISEFNNGQWSFHSKGVWLQQSQNSYLTVVGSSNFNDRSKYRDTEFQLYVYSTCQNLNKQLNKQWDNMNSNCKQITKKQIQEDRETKCNWISRFFSRLFKSFL